MPGQKTVKVKVSFGKALNMLGPYAWAKVNEQIRTVALIVCYLLLFQLLVLSVPIADAALLAVGIGAVILGLAFFMEGLFLGLMPLGEACGIRLPQKTALPVILAFAFILGLGATFAEPAIGVLRMAGASVTAWDAPLLFLLLNRHADALVWAVGTGVGIAVLFGMLRFLYGWSLKPFISPSMRLSGHCQSGVFRSQSRENYRIGMGLWRGYHGSGNSAIGAGARHRCFPCSGPQQ